MTVLKESTHRKKYDARPVKRPRFRGCLFPESLFFAFSLILFAQPIQGEILQKEESGRIIKAVRIEGAEEADRQLIFSELLSVEGAAVSEKNLEADRRHLNRLGIFRSVEISEKKEGEEVILNITVVPRARYLPLVDMGSSDENSFAIGGGIQSSNMLGSGLIFTGKARTGGESRLQLQLENPKLRSNSLDFKFSLQGIDRFNDLERFEEGSVNTELRISRRLSENFHAGGLMGWFFLHSNLTEITLDDGKTDNIPELGIFLDYDDRDQLTTTRKGWNNELQLSRHGMYGIGRSEYWALTLDLRRYQPLAERHVLFLSALARTRTGSVGTEVPVHQNFHLGGTNTVRGWNRDSGRGKNEFIGTAEYRYRVMEPKKILTGKFGDRVFIGFELALFADAGKAWGNPGDPGSDRVLSGYGLGLRLLMPFVNVIRLDFAFGEPGEGIFPHFGVTPKAEKQRMRIR